MLAYGVNLNTMEVRVFARLLDARRMVEPPEFIVSNEDHLENCNAANQKLTELYNKLRPDEKPRKRFPTRSEAVIALFEQLEEYSNNVELIKWTPDTPAASRANKAGRVSSLSGYYLYPTEASMKENPRRFDSYGWKSMEILRANPGMTFEAYIEAKGRAVDLRWDIHYGHTEVTREPRETPKEINNVKSDPGAEEEVIEKIDELPDDKKTGDKKPDEQAAA